jgi:hypothetical protein
VAWTGVTRARARPDGDERVQAARWYTEWTGAAAPRRGGIDGGPQPPGFGCRDAADAYDRYIDFLSYWYASASQALPQRRRLRILTRRRRQPGQAGTDGPALPGATQAG